MTRIFLPEEVLNKEEKGHIMMEMMTSELFGLNNLRSQGVSEWGKRGKLFTPFF